jgi:hypothetical protein
MIFLSSSVVPQSPHSLRTVRRYTLTSLLSELVPSATEEDKFPLHDRGGFFLSQNDFFAVTEERHDTTQAAPLSTTESGE